MTQKGALSQGLRSVRERPYLLLIEIAWRWCFGLFMVIAVALAVAIYLRYFPISPEDMRALHSMVPILVATVIAKLVIDTGPALLRIVLVLVPVLLLGWALLASIGRSAVLSRIAKFPARPAFAASFALHFWRALLAFIASIAALLVVVGAGFAGVGLTHSMQPNIALTAAILFPGLLIVAFAWSVVNWYLSVAVLFAHAGRSMGGALREGYRFSRRRRRELARIAFAMGVLRLFWFLVMTIASLLVAALLARTSTLTAIVLLLALTLIYFAVADLFSLARWLAYFSLLKQETC